MNGIPALLRTCCSIGLSSNAGSQKLGAAKITPSAAERATALGSHAGALAYFERAQQVTTDLAGFWSRHYPAVRRELMRRYPRHAWPEDPLHAEPPQPRRR